MVYIYQRSKNMNDSSAVIKYGRRSLLEHQNSQENVRRRWTVDAPLFVACDPTPAVIESLCSVWKKLIDHFVITFDGIYPILFPASRKSMDNSPSSKP